MGRKDITQKSFFENAKHFADIMNVAFFDGEVVLTAEELLLENSALQMADENSVIERIRDVVKKHTKDGVQFAIYILESQSEVDYSMLIRVMVEESMAYQKQVREIQKRNVLAKKKLSKQEFLSKFRKADRLTPIYTLVLYWGDAEWDAATTLREIVDVHTDNPKLEKKLLELLPRYSIRVYDLNKHKEFHKFQTSLKTIFEFYSNRKDGNKLKCYMREHMSEIRGLDEESKFLVATLLKERRLVSQLNEANEKDEREETDMCQAIEELIEEGRIEGQKKVLLEMLKELGDIDDVIRKKIQKENDSNNIMEWCKIAMKIKTISDFRKVM